MEKATILNLARNSKYWTIAARGSLGALCGSACPIVLDFSPPEIKPTDQLDFVEKVVANYLELLASDYGCDYLFILLGDCDPLLFHVLLKLFTNDIRWAKCNIIQPIFHGSDWTWRILKKANKFVGKKMICASCGAMVMFGRVFFNYYFCNESCETQWMESDTGKAFLKSEQERQEDRYIDWYPGN